MTNKRKQGVGTVLIGTGLFNKTMGLYAYGFIEAHDMGVALVVMGWIAIITGAILYSSE